MRSGHWNGCRDALSLTITHTHLHSQGYGGVLVLALSFTEACFPLVEGNLKIQTLHLDM